MLRTSSGPDRVSWSSFKLEIWTSYPNIVFHKYIVFKAENCLRNKIEQKQFLHLKRLNFDNKKKFLQLNQIGKIINPSINS